MYVYNFPNENFINLNHPKFVDQEINKRQQKFIDSKDLQEDLQFPRLLKSIHFRHELKLHRTFRNYLIHLDWILN